MDNVVTCFEEQIHVHLCDKGSSKLRDMINGLKSSDYQSLKTIDSSSLGHTDAAL